MAEPAMNASFAVAIIQLIGQLAWPIALLLVVYRFRKQIERLLSRVASVKVAGSEWVFQEPAAESLAMTSRPASAAPEVGPDDFLSAEGVRQAISNSGLVEANEPLERELLIFQTPEQRTWLVVSSNYTFVVLDDRGTRARGNLVQTSFARSKTLPLRFDSDNGAGIVKFAAEPNWWYYSVQLFPSTSRLQSSVEKLVA